MKQDRRFIDLTSHKRQTNKSFIADACLTIFKIRKQNEEQFLNENLSAITARYKMESDDDFFNDDIFVIPGPSVVESVNDENYVYEEKIKSKRKEFQALEDRKKELDLIITELHQAVLIRKELDKCSSIRNKTVEITAKAKFIYPKTVIIILGMKNYSKFHFRNWNIALNLCHLNPSCEIDQPCHSTFISKTVKIVSLKSNEEMETSLFVSMPVKLPILLESQLVKVFNVDQAYTYKLGLQPILLTIWDLLSKEQLVFPIDNESKKTIKKPRENLLSIQKSILKLPNELLYLCNLKRPSPEEIIKFLLPISASYAIVDSSTIRGFVPLEDSTSDIMLKVTIHTHQTEILLQSKNVENLGRLTIDLKARILVLISQIHREPKQDPDIMVEKKLDFRNLDALWDSTMNKFSRRSI